MNEDFEIELLAYLRYRGDDILSASADYIKECVRQPSSQVIFNIMFACYSRYNALPTFAVAQRIVQEQAVKDANLTIVLSDVQEKLETIYSLSWEDIASMEYAIIPQLKERLLENTAFSLVTDRKADGDDLIRERIELLDRLNFHSESGESFLDTIEIPTTEDFLGGKLIRSPWSSLNQWMKFGSFCPGNLILFSGNRLKSMVLNHITANAFQYQDAHCAYLSAELTKPEVKDRLKACLLQKDIKDVTELTQQEIDTVRSTPGEHRDIWVDFIPAGTATVSDIRVILKKVQNKRGKIDLIIVDYADLLTTRERHEREDLKLQHISTELKGLAGEMESVLITASQLDTETVKGMEAGRIKMVSSVGLAGAKSKRHAADMVVSICQTKEEANMGKMHFTIAKSRNGVEQKMIYLDVHHKKMSFSECPEYQIGKAGAVETKAGTMHE